MILPLIGAGIAAIIAVLILWWAVACRRGTFPRNHLLGIRTPTTRGNHEAWVAAHRAGAPSLMIAGAGTLLSALIAIIFTIASTPAPAVPLAFTLAFIWALGWIITGSLTGTRASRSISGVSGSEKPRA